MRSQSARIPALVAILFLFSLLVLSRLADQSHDGLSKLRDESTVLPCPVKGATKQVAPTTSTAKQVAPTTSTAKQVAPTTSLEACMPPAGEKLKFLSQSQEDRRLLSVFKNLCKGTYIEMGALDGVKYSNSHVFNKSRGWKGVLIEGAPSNYKNLVKNRRNEIATVHAAVCDQEQKIHFVEREGRQAVGGIYEFAPESFRKHWWPGIDVSNLPETVCLPMTEILDKHANKVTHFDFWSLDIEGAELVALKSLNFDKYSFGVIFIEADSHDPQKNEAVRNLLDSKGYFYHSHWERSDWFIHKEFYSIYNRYPSVD